MAAMDPDQQALASIVSNMRSVFYGDPQVVGKIVIGLISGGHILIEDVPGVGKTVLARALAASVQCVCNRVQLTPDLLPSDILGVSVYNSESGRFDFKKGPIFTNILLADEINRTTPRTQSALLEAMSECQVSLDSQTFPLPKPFMVLATQNPFEFEGTFFLPENQLDRFLMAISVGYPDRESEKKILAGEPGETVLGSLKPVASPEQIMALQQRVRQVSIRDELVEYLMAIVAATREHPDLLVGASPRAALALQRVAKASAVLVGRDYCIPDDIKGYVLPVLSHRLISKKFAHEPSRQSCEHILRQILNQVAVPG